MTPVTIDTLDAFDADALRAMAALGAAPAAAALGTLARRAVRAHLAQPVVVPCTSVAHEIGVPHGPVLVAVRMAVHGAVDGHAIVVLHAADAQALGAALLDRPFALDGTLDPLGESALRECGNIVAGAYLGALADATGLALVPSPPTLHVGPASRALGDALRGTACPAGRVLCVESELEAEGERPLRAWFLLVPSPASVAVLLAARERA